jgi:hypothetical protein
MKVLMMILALLAMVVVAGDKAEPKELTAAREAYIAALKALDAASKDAVEKAAINKEIAAVHKLAGEGEDPGAARVAALLPGTWKGVVERYEEPKREFLVSFQRDGTWASRREGHVDITKGTWKLAGSTLLFNDNAGHPGGTAGLSKIGSRAFTLDYPDEIIRGKPHKVSVRLTKIKDD